MSEPKFTKGIKIDKQGRIEIDTDQILPLYLREMQEAGVCLAPGNAFNGKVGALALEVARSIAIFDCKMTAREAAGDKTAAVHLHLIDGGGEGWMRLDKHADGKDPDKLALALRPVVRPALIAIISKRKGRPIKEPADAWVKPAWWKV